MLLRTIVLDLYRTCLRLCISLIPLLAWMPAWWLADQLWRSVLLAMDSGDPIYRYAYLAWPSASLLGPALTMAVTLVLRRNGVVRPLTAFAAVAGMACAVVLTGWPEAARLLSYRAAYSWFAIFQIAQLNIGLACLIGALVCSVGVRVLLGKPLRGAAFKPLERAKTDTFGHADWMTIKEAAALFKADGDMRS